MFDQFMNDLPQGLLAVLLIIGGVLLLTYVVVKISRQGGLGTMIVLLVLTGVSGILAMLLAGLIDAIEMRFGVFLGLPEKTLLIYLGAFSGMLVHAIWNGLRGKGYKVKVED